jgi:hypothetical protein
MQQIKTKEQTNKQTNGRNRWMGRGKQQALYVGCGKHRKSTDMGLVGDAHIEMTSKPEQTTNDI